jgi:hypothetical protein
LRQIRFITHSLKEVRFFLLFLSYWGWQTVFV